MIWQESGVDFCVWWGHASCFGFSPSIFSVQVETFNFHLAAPDCKNYLRSPRLERLPKDSRDSRASIEPLGKILLRFSWRFRGSELCPMTRETVFITAFLYSNPLLFIFNISLWKKVKLHYNSNSVSTYFSFENYIPR